MYGQAGDGRRLRDTAATVPGVAESAAKKVKG